MFNSTKAWGSAHIVGESHVWRAGREGGREGGKGSRGEETKPDHLVCGLSVWIFVGEGVGRV